MIKTPRPHFFFTQPPLRQGRELLSLHLNESKLKETYLQVTQRMPLKDRIRRGVTNSHISATSADIGVIKSDTLSADQAGIRLGNGAGTGGDGYVHLGNQAAPSDEGTDNTIIGESSAFALTTGNRNTVIGFSSGNVVSTGNGNTTVGALAGPGGAGLSYCLCLGHGAVPTQSNTCAMGSATNPLRTVNAPLGAGGAAALPPNPEGYFVICLNGTEYKFPYYP